jgi:toxin ParE1/3/4
MAAEPVKFAVLLTQGAEQDVESIYDHVCESDGVANANKVLDGLAAAVVSLATFPARGSYPKELLGLGIKEYRQAFFGPYRMIYRVVERRVFVYVVADGRRDLQSLLTKRLLGA